jgi:hypothetical protein
MEISNFEQYRHLSDLRALLEQNPRLSATLGGDYLITPDVVVLRRAVSDEAINREQLLVDSETARLTPLRSGNSKDGSIPSFLHASVSCKWTLRSDRAQNARSEALNLIRNRKGRVPHIAAITAEPLPGRIASLALGTSDLDCVYHVALPELRNAVVALPEASRSGHWELLDTLVEGRRLRDISDLPLDLSV